MKKVDFDDYVEDYDDILKQQLHFFNSDNSYFAEYKVRLAKTFFQHPPQSILDFGCGVGRSLPFFQKYFPNASLYGCDTSERSLIDAKNKFPSVSFHQTHELLPQKLQFDLIFLSGVFHHIEVADRKSIMELLSSLTKKNGKIVVFEHNPYNPVARHMVNTCPFDRDAVLLKPRELKKLFANAGMENIQCHYTLFFPEALRWLRPLENYLRHLPLGGQYVVSGER